ncbi:AfsR/SARP family transcriptional regulator [Microbispora sp. SCL1-1]|uniref:BTAD domain-containing putative transcriptional regulator n=1 Tax=unclassified Microbispora TaxID=2614687 RepID=UPI0011593EC9|nr:MULTISPECIES: BTAD domain-containing putative transcriptional regulator [unclassified Microbispora]NJP29009.1 AfsR/SARP family transcriptional regulator [Microbispora sp. CL1-1]TQS06481.1 AfsR/SARP family transcriptional regulator [Microbispora sp. SCL1-1]
MRIGILGPLRVTGGDIKGARLRVLLIRLALAPGRVVTAESLAEDLWEEPPANPVAALHSLVSRLRRELRHQGVHEGSHGTVVSHPAGYLLDVPPEEVDAVEFERLVRAGRAERDPRRAAAVLRSALALWRGAALADAAGLPFAQVAAARLEELRLCALEARVAADLAVADTAADTAVDTAAAGALVAELEEVVAAHPLREPFHALLMRALCAAGRRGDALEAFERVRRRLADELGVDPGPELRAAHLEALRYAPPEKPVRAAVRGNVPAPVTSLVGRREDVARVRGLLSAARLVTLTGPGGAGKTRLAVEVAGGLAAASGVWLVELAAAGDAADVVAAVRATVPAATPERDGDVAARPALSPLDALVEALAGRELVLVLDNCEHVVDGAAALAERLLAGVPGLRILATSREPLDVPGEHLHPVRPLALPGDDVDAARALEFPAVALFVARASAARPGFVVDDSVVTDVVAVCRQLDGLPLAIELAAARLRSFTMRQLAEAVGERLALRGGRTAGPRHRSLRAVIEWSWDLLSPQERVALRRLSVFAGGATAEAALRVCGAGLETVTCLVDRSLVVVAEPEGTADRAAQVRYRLLETVRAYAAERLEEAGEARAVRDRHLGYFVEVAEAAEPGLRTAEQLRLLAMLDAERGNLDAALGHAVRTGQKGQALRLFMARLWAWTVRGRGDEAARWARAIRAVLGEAAPHGLELPHALCVLLASDEPYASPEAMRVVEESGHPVALWAWIVGVRPSGGAVDHWRRALAAMRAFGDHEDPWARATGLLMGGIGEFEYGRAGARAAEPWLRAALAGYRALGERWGLSLALYWLSLVAENRGDAAEALTLLEEAAELAGLLGGMEAVPLPMMLRVRLAQLRARTGDVVGAERELVLAGEAADRTPDRLAAARVRQAAGEVARRRGELGEAERLLVEALELVDGQADVPGQFLSTVHVELARVRAELGDREAAWRSLRSALVSSGRAGDETVRAMVLEAVAEWCAAGGDLPRAALVAGAARTLRGLDGGSDGGSDGVHRLERGRPKLRLVKAVARAPIEGRG